MPRVVAGPPSQAAPSAYKLAPSEAFVPESVTATFDGTGAGGTFLPTLSIYSQDGKLIARSPATAIAAGNSAEVTFAPLLRAASAAAAVGTGYPFAVSGVNGFYNVPSGVITNFGIDPGSLITSDATIFSEQASVLPGITGLGIGATGTYRLDWTVNFFDTAGAPVAAPQNFVCEAADGSADLVNILPNFAEPFGRGFVNLTGRSEWDIDVTDVSAVHGATTAGNPVIITANQSTGVQLRAYTQLIAYQLSTSTFGF